MSQLEHEAPRSSPDVVRNTLLNVFGLAAPLVAAIFAIPLLMDALGKDLFGILTIAWMVVGYVSLFDLGIGRALTHSLAETLGKGKAEEAPQVIWTGLLLMLALGSAGGIVLAALSPWIVYEVIDGIPVEAQRDCLSAFYVLAASVPLVVSTTGLRGALEAVHRFDLVNLIRIPQGVYTFAGPLLVLPFYTSLTAVVLALFAGRVAAWAAHVFFCAGAFPQLAKRVDFQRKRAGSLIRYGGWVMVSNGIGPLMVYMDRAVVGAFFVPTAVTYYATPWEVATKLLIIPAALSSVLFPAFSFGRHQEQSKTAQLYSSGVKFSLLALFPVALAIVLLAEPGLRAWLDADMAENSSRVLQILTIGVVLNGIAHVPYSLVQGLGRADLTAKFHLVELAVYGALLWTLISWLGIVGVALAWLLRALLDLTLLLFAANNLLPENRREYGRTAVGIGAAVLSLLIAMAPAGYAMKGIAFAMISGVYIFLAWRFMLTVHDRQLVNTRLARVLP